MLFCAYSYFDGGDVAQVYQDFTAKITGLEERRRLIKEAKDSEVKNEPVVASLPLASESSEARVSRTCSLGSATSMYALHEF